MKEERPVTRSAEKCLEARDWKQPRTMTTKMMAELVRRSPRHCVEGIWERRDSPNRIAFHPNPDVPAKTYEQRMLHDVGWNSFCRLQEKRDSTPFRFAGGTPSGVGFMCNRPPRGEQGAPRKVRARLCRRVWRKPRGKKSKIGRRFVMLKTINKHQNESNSAFERCADTTFATSTQRHWGEHRDSHCRQALTQFLTPIYRLDMFMVLFYLGEFSGPTPPVASHFEQTSDKHWFLFGPSRIGIPCGGSMALEKSTNRRTQGYMGPRPIPVHGPHRYIFQTLEPSHLHRIFLCAENIKCSWMASRDGNRRGGGGWATIRTAVNTTNLCKLVSCPGRYGRVTSTPRTYRISKSSRCTRILFFTAPATLLPGIPTAEPEF